MAAVNLWRDTLPWVGGGFVVVFLLTWGWLWTRTNRDRSPRARDVLDTWARGLGAGTVLYGVRRTRRIIVTGDLPPRVLTRADARRAWPWGVDRDAL